MQIKFFGEQVVVESPVLLIASTSNHGIDCTNVTAMMQPMINKWRASGPDMIQLCVFFG